MFCFHKQLLQADKSGLMPLFPSVILRAEWQDDVPLDEKTACISLHWSIIQKETNSLGIHFCCYTEYVLKSSLPFIGSLRAT